LTPLSSNLFDIEMRTYIYILSLFLAFLVTATAFVLIFFKGHDAEFDQYVSELKPQLSNSDPLKRIEAVEKLAKLKERAKPVLPLMALLLRDEVSTVAESTARALGSMSEIAAPTTSSLIRAMDDSRYAVRQAAVLAIGDIGPNAKMAKDRLMKALNEPKKFSTMIVIRALVKIGEEKVVLAPYIKQVQTNASGALSAAGVLKDSGSEMGYKIGVEYINRNRRK
jgi:HEAT repeat protein